MAQINERKTHAWGIMRISGGPEQRCYMGKERGREGKTWEMTLTGELGEDQQGQNEWGAWCVCVCVCPRAHMCMYVVISTLIWLPENERRHRGADSVGKMAISIRGVFRAQRCGTYMQRWLECRQNYKWNDIFNEKTQSPPGWHRQDGIHAGRAAGDQDLLTTPSGRSTNSPPHPWHSEPTSTFPISHVTLQHS